MLCPFIIFDIYIFILCSKNVKNTLKLYPLRTKNKIKNFVRIKTFSLILQGLKSKFVIFIGTKNLFNPSLKIKFLIKEI